MHTGSGCTRAYFLGRVALLAAGAVSTAFNCPQLPVNVAFTGEMTSAPDYSAWDSVLQKHLKTTEIRGIPVTSVDYQAIRDDPNFKNFVKSLETAQTSGLGKDAEYALWINSYNALAIKMVIDHPCKKKLLGLKKDPIVSIKDIGTLVSPVWKKPAGVVGGQVYSLDDIENIKLRAPTEYPADPLLHSCIVCASVSCPDVALRVFKPETLKDDMEASMKNFLANTKKGLSLDKDAGSITISKIFQWFAGDFTKDGRAPSVLDALLPYVPDDIRPFITENKDTLKVEYFEYDWGLNGPNPGAPGKKGRC